MSQQQQRESDYIRSFDKGIEKGRKECKESFRRMIEKLKYDKRNLIEDYSIGYRQACDDMMMELLKK